eukprot:1856189-Prymnesium_polylepis.1
MAALVGSCSTPEQAIARLVSASRGLQLTPTEVLDAALLQANVWEEQADALRLFVSEARGCEPQLVDGPGASEASPASRASVRSLDGLVDPARHSNQLLRSSDPATDPVVVLLGARCFRAACKASGVGELQPSPHVATQAPTLD